MQELEVSSYGIIRAYAKYSSFASRSLNNQVDEILFELQYLLAVQIVVIEFLIPPSVSLNRMALIYYMNPF